MGCDIHMYVEHRAKDHPEFGWRPFGGRISPGRDYCLFGYIAGVRSDVAPVVEQRGFPNDPAWTTKSENHLYINDKYANEGDEEYVTEAEAQSWVKSGCSKMIYARRDENGVAQGSDQVTHPDWHSHTWLTADELEKAIELANVEYQKGNWGKVNIQYEALLAAMRTLEKEDDVRVVIWFDN